MPLGRKKEEMKAQTGYLSLLNPGKKVGQDPYEVILECDTENLYTVIYLR